MVDGAGYLPGGLGGRGTRDPAIGRGQEAVGAPRFGGSTTPVVLVGFTGSSGIPVEPPLAILRWKE